jgi:hypothetical protein
MTKQTKFMTIQQAVNPAIMASYEVRYIRDMTTFFMVGQVLFYSATGGHWSSDETEKHFVAIYNPDNGTLMAVFNMVNVHSIVAMELSDVEEAE